MLASWIFGGALLVFISAIIVFGLELDQFRQRLVAFLCALLAGLFAFFFTGTLAVNIVGEASVYGKLGVQAGGGLGAFVLVLWWWLSSWSPVTPSVPPIKGFEVTRPENPPKAK